MTEPTTIEKSHGLETTVGVRTQIQRIIAWFHRPGPEVVQEQEWVNLFYLLSGQRLMNRYRSHFHSLSGEDVGDGAEFHGQYIFM
jgi:hypothetical protein